VTSGAIRQDGSGSHASKACAASGKKSPERIKARVEQRAAASRQHKGDRPKHEMRAAGAQVKCPWRHLERYVKRRFPV
ncbi:MAG: hypothetical protein V4793_45175, partial [Paraburkholderia tropica]